jgi:mono/diheme cytochrome c family protein
VRRVAIIGAAALLAACAGAAGFAQGQGGRTAPATQGGAQGQPAGPPPGMPKPQTAASRPNATGGEALYLQHCAMCHGPNGMGTGLLGRRMDTPLLEKRAGLPARYVITAARTGIGNMPAITRGEVSDAELQAIADYLAAGPHP